MENNEITRIKEIEIIVHDLKRNAMSEVDKIKYTIYKHCNNILTSCNNLKDIYTLIGEKEEENNN